MYALLACMLLGFGWGIVNGVIAGIFTFWVTPFALLQIILWIASGVIIVPDELPDVARYYLSFNPVADRGRMDAFGLLRGLWAGRTARQALHARASPSCRFSSAW